MVRPRYSKKTSPIRVKKSVMVILPRVDVTEFLRERRRRSLSIQQNASTTSNASSSSGNNVPCTAPPRLRRRFRVKPEPPCLFHSQVEITDESVEEIPVLVGDPENPCHMCSPRPTEDKSQVWSEITTRSQPTATVGYGGWHVPTPFVPSAPPNVEAQETQTSELPQTETVTVAAPTTQAIEAPLTETIINQTFTPNVPAPNTASYFRQNRGIGVGTCTEDKATQTVRYFACKQCPSLFTDVMHLIHHKAVHQKMFECPFCTANFVSKNDLKSHMKMHMLPKYYDCVYCNQAFTKKFDIREHLALHLDQKQFHCRQCPAKFTQKINLRNHEQSHNVNVSKFIHVFKKVDDGSCPTTPSPKKAARRSGSISSVNKTAQTAETPRPTPCTSYLTLSSIADTTSSSAITPSAIPTPTASVSASEPILPERNRISNSNFFQCNFCPVSFKTRTCLQRHSFCHIRKTGKFICLQCGGRFMKKSGLTLHTRYSHTMI